MSEARKSLAALYTALHSEDKYYPVYICDQKQVINEYSNIVNNDTRKKIISLFSELSKNKE